MTGEPMETTASRPRRSYVRRVLAVMLMAVLALIAIVAVKVAPLLLAPNEYQGTPSIEARADFRDPALILAAWALPVARTYRLRPFEYQDNQSFCGPASIANVLRSSGVEMKQHDVIDGTQYEPWFGILLGGMTLDEAARLLALRTHGRVGVVRDTTLPDFRRLMTLADDPSRRLIVNFHRGPMFGRGHGHFSPILGYLPARDLVLVGDVNKNYAGPYLVPTERLWHAVDTVDGETAKKRGLIIATLP